MHTSSKEPIHTVPQPDKRQVAELSVDHVRADQSDPSWLGSWWRKLCWGQPRVKRNYERGRRSFWAVFCLLYWIIWEKAPQLWLDSCYTGASTFFFSVFSHWLSSLEGKTEARGSERLFRLVAMCRPPARCHWNTSEPLWSSWQIIFPHLLPTQ